MRTPRVAATSIVTIGLLLIATLGVIGQDAEGRAPILSDGCGTSEVLVGRQSGAMQVGDLERSRVLDVPSAHDWETPLPLVVLLHGGGLDPDGFIAMTGFADVADEQGFVIVAPRSRDDPERWMWEPESAETDLTMANPDIAFVDDLIDVLADDLCLDLARIYATGWSMGGGGVSVLGCVLDDRIAAVAPVSTTDDHGEACNERRPVSVLAFHGTGDGVVLYEGGFNEWFLDSVGPDGTRVRDLAWVNEPRVAIPFPDRLVDIAIRNGCEPEPVSEMIAPNVERLSWACPEGADVALVAAGGHGHSWPGSAEAATWALTTMEVDATAMTWDFFEQHPLP